MNENATPGIGNPRARILFVEDEATLREHLAQKLSDEFLVDTAGNGNEALLAVMRAKPAIVVTDIVMPDMDGVELLKTLRQSPGTRGIPVLLISGRAADEYRIEAFEQGADGFLAKPYTERELRALIGSMLRAAKSRAEAAGREARDQLEKRAAIDRATLDRALADLQGREEQLRHKQLQLAALEEALRRVNELLAVLGVTRGSIALKRDKVVLAEVLANAVDASRPAIESQAHELQIHLHPAAPVFVAGDPTRLTQVFVNLLSNSAHYTSRGGRITLELDCRGGEAVVTVRDTGIGIAPDALERVFELFSQSRPAEDESDAGLGIGLALVRAITHLHGGSVSAWSDGPGTGSVFTVRLPVMSDSLAV
jgi:signal transduction histidine kinase